MSEASTNKAPLEDLMAAMDVVDTLRHQRGIVERELDGEGRRERLLTRLKDLYAAQGIDVPEHVLEEGIDALEQERFSYTPVAPSWRTRLASIWVSRGRWGKPLGFFTALGGLFSGVYFVSDVMPERELRANLPSLIAAKVIDIESIAQEQSVSSNAKSRAAAANQAIDRDELEQAEKIDAELQETLSRLRSYYSIRIISRPGEDSGVWRIPDINKSSRNYYLIVEAIDKNNNVVELDILNEETNKRSRVRTWGLRVNEETFFSIAADKKDDGIIQENLVGEKAVGYLTPKFSIPTTGGAITDWRR